MGSKRPKYIIASFFLIAFLSVKVTGVHGFVHFSDDSDMATECVFCDDFLTQNATPLLNNGTVKFNILPEFVFRNIHNNYQYTYYNKEVSYYFRNRPPPVLPLFPEDLFSSF